LDSTNLKCVRTTFIWIMACADDLAMGLREDMIEIKLARQDANYLRSVLGFQSEQNVPKGQNEHVNEVTRSRLDSDGTLTNASTTSNGCGSGMHVPDMVSDAPFKAATESAHPMTEEFVVKQAFQITNHNVEDIVMRSRQSPPQRVQGTCEERVIEKLPPLPKKLMRTQSSVPESSPHFESAILEVPGRVPAMDDDVTTLIIRSIPHKTCQESLIALWPPTWGYDFLHLPYSLKQRRSCGYAFINFVSSHSAKLFYNHWQGQLLAAQNHTKALAISAADVQGVLPNLKHFQIQVILK